MSKDIVKEVRRATRRRFSSEEKIRIVLEGLRGGIPITDLCRREGITRHFDRFQTVYEERYQSHHGFLRPIIPEVVNKFIDCGHLERGFARIRCDHCKKDHLLAFWCFRHQVLLSGQPQAGFSPRLHLEVNRNDNEVAGTFQTTEELETP